jgi:UDP-glucuronate decarboxylase
MRVLVTGASGFIGQHLLPLLRDAGHEVCGTYNIKHIDFPGVRIKKVNLFNRHEVEQVLNTTKPDALIHLAWYVTSGSYQSSMSNLDWCSTTTDLMRSFAECGGRRAVFAGSCFEYDLSMPNYQMENNVMPRCHTFYGACKKATGDIVLTMPVETTAVWARIFYLYGPGERKHRLVPSVITSLLKGQTADCSHGKQVRDFLHVEDVASALVSLLASDLTGAVNIGSGEGVTIKQVATTIAAKLGKSGSVNFGAITPPPNDPLLVIAYNNKLRSTGWSPKYNLNTGLENTIDWWKRELVL